MRKSTMLGSHPEQRTARAAAFFLRERGLVGYCERAQAIDALPAVAWRGQTLRTLTCHGTRGKGPHPTNVPEALLWSLIDFRAFRCPFHLGD